MRKDIKKKVKSILENNPEVRGNDMELIIRIADDYIPVDKISFKDGCDTLKNYGISFESITRARRDIESKYPYLKNKEAEKARQKEYENYYVEYRRDY